MNRSTLFRFAFLLFLGVIVGLFTREVLQRQWLETDLQALLPQTQQWTAIQQLADQKQEQQLNRQFVALVGHTDRQIAFELAWNVEQAWQKSGLFSHIFFQTQPDLAQLQQDIQQLKWAVLPTAIRTQLLQDPAAYFQQYAQQLTNPFQQTNLLPLAQDWLGLGRFVLPQSQQLSQMQWDMQNGTIFVQKAGVTWILLRAKLKNHDVLNSEQGLLALVNENRQQIQQQAGEFLAASTALFGAYSKQQAEQESTLMTVLGISLTLLLLLSVFRSIKMLWLFLPIGIGMFTGMAITVLLLGQIHILTLVVGTSLIGVLIDFPLHWLASALGQKNWQAQQTMKAHIPTFFISLWVTLLGYGLLWFTDLPVLKQTALFSAVALVSAILTTVLFLPIVLRNVDFSRRKTWTFSPSLSWQQHKKWHIVLICMVLIGVYRSQWRDDIRQWVSLPTEMIQQMQKLGELSGIDLGSQYFLVVAENDDALLEKTAKLSQNLTALSQPHQALSQWIINEEQQKYQARQLLSHVTAQDYQPLVEMGIPGSAITQSLVNLSTQPSISLQHALSTLLGKGWNTLYLGQLASQQVATLVKINGRVVSEKVPLLANGGDIFWQDKRGALNQAFQETRNQAAWLKVLSFFFAGLLLWRLFSFKKATQILIFPLIAIVATVAVFGWLGLPITLFTLFGLLLVSAIGVDYCAYQEMAKEPKNIKQTALMLTAFTTMISFGLLALSSTPAVASFGLSVTVGVIVLVLLNLGKTR